MNSAPATVIHIGFPKAASTTLQLGVFDQHPEILHVGRQNWKSDDDQLIYSLIFDDDQYYDEAACKKLFNDFEKQAHQNGLTTIVSNEHFVRSTMRSLAPMRLARLMPDAKILVVIRNQFDAVASMYAAQGRYLRSNLAPKPYKGRYVTFENWFEFALENWKSSYLGAIDYDATIGLYEKHFGHENVECILFEDLIKSPHITAEKIAKLAEVNADLMKELLSSSHENKRVSSRIVHYHRIRRYFLPQISFSSYLPSLKFLTRLLSQGKAYRHDLSPSTRETISELYREGNRALEDRFGLPLSENGYPT